jgi:NADH:ubiquinone oxidoreductase subunit
MRRAIKKLSGGAAATAPAVVVGHVASMKPNWWMNPVAVPPSEAELALFEPTPVVEKHPTRYKKHPWFRNFGQDRLCIVDPPPRGEFFRFIAFWNLMKEKVRELGIKGSLVWLVIQMRRQKEAWYQKGFDSELVGIDELGNKYWQSTYTTALQSRWIEYPNQPCFKVDSTVVSPDWYQWLHHLPNPNPHEVRQRFPDSYGKGLTSDYWYRMRWTELLYDTARQHYPRGHAHPDNAKFDDFVIRNRRVSRRKGFMEFDPFVLPAERLRKRQKWTSNPIGDRRHAWPGKKLPL